MAGTTAEQATRPTDWSAALQQVLAEPWRVRPAYQPIVDLDRHSLWGFQVLARFISPLRATPPEWLEAATQLGLRGALEARLLETGLQAIGELPDRCRLLLPLSPAAVTDPAVQRELGRNVRIAPRIVLDITPADDPVDVGELAAALQPLRRDGCGISLLAGGSPGGLDALPRLRPDLLKLGPDYVAGLTDDGDRRAVVEGLVTLVEALGGRVLAVGVEEQDQLDALAAARIAFGQGFGLGRPVPSMAASLTRASAPLLNG
jgi:EAL domain-containing protein (putative c-di-GMP-specific phosphodiesterase class I)